jgi:hypothetical protein
MQKYCAGITQCLLFGYKKDTILIFENIFENIFEILKYFSFIFVFINRE